jgi:hypothetical protein
MHIDERDEVALVTHQRRRRKPRCVGGSWFFVITSFVATTRIYREDPSRVIASRNRLGLSLSKRIRNKNKWQKKVIDQRGFGPDFGGPFMRASCARVHHQATARRACMFVSPFLLFSTLLQLYREQPTVTP